MVNPGLKYFYITYISRLFDKGHVWYYNADLAPFIELEKKKVVLNEYRTLQTLHKRSDGNAASDLSTRFAMSLLNSKRRISGALKTIVYKFIN